MKKLDLSALLLTAALTVGCNDISPIASVLDSAGSNRSELEAVLDHYKTKDANRQKLLAAEFLIKNMPAHYSYAGDEIYEYYDYAARILANKSLSPEQQRDSLLFITDLKYRDLPGQIVSDAQIIKADYLIKNIDTSYDRWDNCDWASQITFDEYLEWLLPYKAIELQEMDAWRDTLLAHFGKGLENPIVNYPQEKLPGGNYLLPGSNCEKKIIMRNLRNLLIKHYKLLILRYTTIINQ